jgi:hypothetical protein
MESLQWKDPANNLSTPMYLCKIMGKTMLKLKTVPQHLLKEGFLTTQITIANLLIRR